MRNLANIAISKFSIRCLGKATNYERAREKLQKAETTSDIQTTDTELQKERRPKLNKRVLPSDSESECYDILVPPPPKSFIPCYPLSTSSSLVSSHSLVSSQSPSNFNLPRPSETLYTTRPSNLLNDSTGQLNRIENLLGRVLRQLEEVKETQRVQMTMFRSQQPVQNVAILPEGAIFPLLTEEDFTLMERKLDDINFLNSVVNFIADIGGNTLKEATKRMMAFVMSNNLAMKFNVFGRGGKRGFGSTRLFDTVYKAIKGNQKTAEVNKKDFEKAVGKWLLRSRDRDGNRANRVRASAIAE
ncbi:uncharacterized protein LOC124813180 isoform X2 [Hydra vulgaris]|uniref:Uncharacterized protein LOC124813180 isoform X2 n=1 Tax=Hydra vulgaris TaxID=6087 RepID=A0ABM4CUJ2_HYDVU